MRWLHTCECMVQYQLLETDLQMHFFGENTPDKLYFHNNIIAKVFSDSKRKIIMIFLADSIHILRIHDSIWLGKNCCLTTIEHFSSKEEVIVETEANFGKFDFFLRNGRIDGKTVLNYRRRLPKKW